MGLDTVEIVLEIEEEFGIKIENHESESCVTVGNLSDLVRSKLNLQNSGRCESAATFYTLRRKIVSDFRIDRSNIRTSTKVSALVPAVELPNLWMRLSSTSAFPFPALRRASWITHSQCVAVSIAFVGVSILAKSVIVGFFATLLAAGIAEIGARLLIRIFPQFLKPPIETVGELASRTFALSGELTDDKVFTRVVRIVSEQLSVPEEEIKAETRFVEDLGA